MKYDFKLLSRQEFKAIQDELCGPLAVRMVQQSRAGVMRWYSYVERFQPDAHLWSKGMLPETVGKVSRAMGMRKQHQHEEGQPYRSVGDVLHNMEEKGIRFALVDVVTYGGWHLFAVVDGVVRDFADWNGDMSSCRYAYGRKTPPPAVKPPTR